MPQVNILIHPKVAKVAITGDSLYIPLGAVLHFVQNIFLTIEVGDIVASSGIFTVSISGSYSLECEPFPRRSEAVKQG